jgi:hypothetical protein
MQADMAREDQLCLLLARGRLSAEARGCAAELLASPLCWPLVLELTYAHQILPLLYRNLRAFGFPGVPGAVRAELTSAFRINALRNTLLAEELVRVLRLLGGAGVPVMPLKGTPLAESLYGDSALRVCADIDILVPPKHLAEAFHLLLSSGYEAGFTQPRLVDLLARYGKDCGVLMRQDRTCVYPLQLHCGLVWGGPVERDLLEEVWSEAARKSFHGVQAFTLSAEWEFLYLAVHAARHGLLPLKWLVDLDELCFRGTVDWESVREKAGLLGWEEAVQSSLSACASFLDTPLHPLFSAAKPRPSRGFDALRLSALQVPREALFTVGLLKRRSRKLRFLAVRLFVPTPADCRFLPLPSCLFFLYYPLRPLRLGFMLAGRLVQAGLMSVRGRKRESRKSKIETRNSKLENRR